MDLRDLRTTRMKKERDRAVATLNGVVGALRSIVGVDNETEVTAGQLVDRVSALLTGFSMGLKDIVRMQARIDDQVNQIAALRSFMAAHDITPPPAPPDTWSPPT